MIDVVLDLNNLYRNSTTKYGRAIRVEKYLEQVTELVGVPNRKVAFGLAWKDYNRGFLSSLKSMGFELHPTNTPLSLVDYIGAMMQCVIESDADVVVLGTNVLHFESVNPKGKIIYYGAHMQALRDVTDRKTFEVVQRVLCESPRFGQDS